MERNTCFSEIDPVLVFLAIYGKIKFVVADKGFPIEQGIVLVADNEQKAAQFQEEFYRAFDNVAVYQRWNNKSEKPDNYFVGLILSRGKNIEHVQEFLQERDFLSVVITGGILPDSLRTDTYIMRITDGTMEALRNPQILKMLCEIGDRCTNEIDYLSKKIDETSLKICSMNILEEQRNLYFGFILCGSIFFEKLLELVGREEGSELWIKYLNRIEKLLYEMDDYVGGIDVVEAIVESIFDYVDNSDKRVTVIDKDCVTKNDMESIERQEGILCDDMYYYIPQRLFTEMCRGILGIWSGCELKKRACDLNVLVSDNSADNTCKITVNIENQKKRLRFLKVVKDCFLSRYSEGLEGICKNKNKK